MKQTTLLESGGGGGKAVWVGCLRLILVCGVVALGAAEAGIKNEQARRWSWWPYGGSGVGDQNVVEEGAAVAKEDVERGAAVAKEDDPQEVDGGEVSDLLEKLLGEFEDMSNEKEGDAEKNRVLGEVEGDNAAIGGSVDNVTNGSTIKQEGSRFDRWAEFHTNDHASRHARIRKNSGKKCTNCIKNADGTRSDKTHAEAMYHLGRRSLQYSTRGGSSVSPLTTQDSSSFFKLSDATGFNRAGFRPGGGTIVGGGTTMESEPDPSAASGSDNGDGVDVSGGGNTQRSPGVGNVDGGGSDPLTRSTPNGGGATTTTTPGTARSGNGVVAPERAGGGTTPRYPQTSGKSLSRDPRARLVPNLPTPVFVMNTLTIVAGLARIAKHPFSYVTERT